MYKFLLLSGLMASLSLHFFAKFQNDYSGNIRVTKPVLVFHDNIVVIHYVADDPAEQILRLCRTVL